MTPYFDGTQDLFGSEGLDGKREGLEQVTKNNPDFVTTMRDIAISMSLRWGSVNSDDLRRAALEMSLEPNHPNAWGAVFRGKEWKPIGWKHSRLKSNHARMIRVWRYDP